ncbi:DNA-binding response regulator, NarL/FixJ family, contains REC and HTH domains [Streptomyces zhaozhouensis]|uniref:DNA-binding response regulator, NarL/FixJ family, contains REC and HTH domains n=1 Tax=Streptomyces zhaozhouensis TaxID=1300267 RepID=A0A286E6V3_9ACTN|nr:response regulator transcription factor [Streptomyces zhaozhouensis]SOD66619.1 DNA-binding response regulator, NarL/FixJ family, contains REC and HTH domains [Streptomyces zhaozhouensis]
MSLTVVLAEDSALLRDGLVGVLTRFGHRVVAAVGDADALVERALEHAPDVVITDVRMPPGNGDDGLRAALALRAARPGLPVLVLSQYLERSYVDHLLRLGGELGVGYLLKDRVAAVADFVAAVERVAAGGTALDPEVVRQLLRRGADPVSRLTPREHEVLALMAEGLGNTEIADRLHVSGAAVNKHIGAILRKLELHEDVAGHRRVLAVLAYLGGGA